MPHLRASPVLAGQAIITFAGKDVAVSLNGMIPSEVSDITTIRNYMVAGSLDELIANPDGIVVGDGLVRKLSLSLGRERDADLADRRGADVQDPRAVPYRARHLRRHAGLRRSEARAGAAEAAEPGQYDHRQARRSARRAAGRRRDRAPLRLQERVVAGSQRRFDEHAGDAKHHHVHGRQRRADRRGVRHLQRDLDGRAGKAARHRDPEIDRLPRPRHPPRLSDPGAAARDRGQRRRAAARRGADVGADAGPAEISRRHRSGAVADRLELAAIRDRRGVRDRGRGVRRAAPARKGARVQPVDILRGAQ